MIEEPTVFILEAGASAPYGYPTGDDLKDDIVENFPSMFASNLNSMRNPYYESKWKDRVLEFTENLRGAPGSIDLFLSRQPEFADLGKVAILLAIFKHEYDSDRSNVQNINKTWLSYLYTKMTGKHRRPGQIEFGGNRVSFITFNYDRCLEHYLFQFAMSDFGAEYGQEIIEEIKKIPIIHVYGKVADLPYEQSDGNGRLIFDYGTSPLKIDLFGGGGIIRADDTVSSSVLKQIQVIDEQKDNADSVTRTELTSDLIRAAKRIIFLGFRYADENMEVLRFPEVIESGQNFLGTRYGMTDHEVATSVHRFISGPKINSGRKEFNDRESDALQFLRDHL